MKQLLIATSNQAKVDEIRRYLKLPHITLLSLKDIGIIADAEETGRTFVQNALGKAHYYMKKSGLPSLADDGGIEIDALGGEPGVDAHRWISRTHDDPDEDLIQYTFTRMSSVSKENRGAQMHLILALVFPDGQEYTSEGIVRGVIALKPSDHRTPGFPYRSVFFLPELNKFYDHQMLTENESEKYNHRKKALDALIPILLDKLK